jgi:acyl-coenzyme A synthetase/AMP-(fatty) acid ligase
LCFPLGNITGLYSTLPAMFRGRIPMLVDRFNLAVWHRYVVNFRPENGGLPPAGVRMILDASIPRDDLSSIKFVATGAAPLDPAVHRAFEARYGIPILLSYGATEFGGPVTAMTLELHAEWGERKFGSVGRAIAGAKLRVVDPVSGAELPPGEEGILEVVSPRIGAAWMRTSDIALIDEDGFLYHRGRADGAIMRGGFKLVPDVIERALQGHPAVAESAVVGRPDRRLGEVPVAAIQLKPAAAWPGEEALVEHLRKQLPATHIPVTFLEVDELPRTPSMKLDRPALKCLFERPMSCTPAILGNLGKTWSV